MIEQFQGAYRFLSNFHPCEVEYEGDTYPSVEHAYQAAKTTVALERWKIKQCETPGKAKRAARTLILRPDWNQIKLTVMRQLLEQKFAAGTELAERLIRTGDEYLIEGNNWGDEFWGCTKRGGRWRGSNYMGKTLMAIRTDLKAHRQTVYKEGTGIE